MTDASLPEPAVATRQEVVAARRAAAVSRVRVGDLVAVAIVAGAVAVYLVRGFGRVASPTFFAEDGVIFFAGPYKGILASLLNPYNGYLETVPRLVAIAYHWFPVAWQPRLWVVTAIVVTLAMFSPVLSRRLAWLLPTRPARAVAFLALCLLPTILELYGVVTNTIWAAGVAVLLLALSDDPATRTGRGVELVALVLLCLSGPLGLLLLPTFAYRWWRVGRSRHSLYALVLAGASSAVQLGVYLTSARRTPDTGTLAIFGEGLLKRVVATLLVRDPQLPQAYSRDHLALWGSLWVGLAVVGIGVALRSRALPLLYAALVTFGAGAYAYGAQVIEPYSLQRVLLVAHAAIVIGLVATIFKARPGGRRARTVQALAAGAALVCAATMLPGVIRQLPVARFPNAPLDVTAFQRCLDSRAATCVQPTWPPGWKIVVDRTPRPQSSS